jgi:hypothetical protein
MKNDNMYKNNNPTQGFKISGGFSDLKTKSIQDLGPNKIKAHGDPRANTLSGKYAKFVISVTIAFDVFMRFMIDPRVCRDQKEVVLFETSFFGIITFGSVLFLGCSSWVILFLPVLMFVNAIRYTILHIMRR